MKQVTKSQGKIWHTVLETKITKSARPFCKTLKILSLMNGKFEPVLKVHIYIYIHGIRQSIQVDILTGLEDKNLH